jgi:hypothetical protein
MEKHPFHGIINPEMDSAGPEYEARSKDTA